MSDDAIDCVVFLLATVFIVICGTVVVGAFTHGLWRLFMFGWNRW